MKLTDSHCHLADPQLMPELPEILDKARAAGVWRFLIPASSPADWQAVAALADKTQMPSEQAIFHIALGIHPWFSDGVCEADFHTLTQMLEKHPDAWVGEIGLDFQVGNPNPAQRRHQRDIFVRQLEYAESLGRRVVIHNLKATAAVADALKAARFTQGGIAHAFSGSLEEARILLRCGLKIGIGSLLLNPNAKKVRAVLRDLDDSDFVLETDSPFMLKNAVNTPANLKQIAQTAAEIRGTTPETLAAQTERNIESLLCQA